MRHGFLAVTSTLAAAIVVSLLSVFVSGQAPTAGTGTAPRTALGEPDLQGIWTDEYTTPLERPARYAGKEFFTEGELAALEKERQARVGVTARGRLSESKRAGGALDSADSEKAAKVRGTEADVAGAYNREVFGGPLRPLSRRTSLIVDPPDGRIPSYTAEAKKTNAIFREYELAILQATQQCKNKSRSCVGGTYGSPSARLAEPPPAYNWERLNRSNGPEDRGLMERCMLAALPDFGGYRRIVQSSGVVTISYDTGQGQGWERVIPVGSTPHFPPNIRQWWGDSRGHWEGNTLVVDVTNFTPKQMFLGSRENLHLVERWTRRDATTLEYTVTIEDPTVWTKPWTVKQELTRQNEQENRIYSEPRCHEGNFGMVGLLAGARAAEKAFAEGRGPDPATLDVFSTGPTFIPEGDVDPLAGGVQTSGQPGAVPIR